MDQPPNKQEYIRDLSNTMNVAAILVFSVSRTVQLWSRVPGSTGSWFFGWMFLVGLVVQAGYYQIHVMASNRFDAVPYQFTASLSLIWFSVHGLLTGLSRRRGMQLHSYEPGRGICSIIPAPAGTTTLISDLAVAISLSAFLRQLDSPIQSRWYLWMCLWVIVGQGWVQVRDARRRQAWEDSQREAEVWQQQIEGRQQ